MAIDWSERPDSRPSTMEPPTIVYKYSAAGENDQDTVRAFALSATPALVSSSQGILYRQDIAIDPRGFKLWYVDVPYGKQKKENGSMRLSFSTMGGTERRKVSFQTVNKYPRIPFVATDYGGAIGVSEDNQNIEGADVVIPALKLTVVFKHPNGFISLPQIKVLARATGTVNSVTFLTFEAGEVLLLGCSGEEGTDTETSVQYELACSENIRNQTMGGIDGIDKDGWDVAWVRFRNKTDAGKAALEPECVYIERVYRRKNLAAILGFGG